MNNNSIRLQITEWTRKNVQINILQLKTVSFKRGVYSKPKGISNIYNFIEYY